MAELGKFNTLPVVTVNENGAYLNADNLGEVLLPNRLMPDGCDVGEEVSVFLYKDSAERIAATTQQPLGEVGQFVSLKVSAINKMGAFLDWGLPKELLVPYNEQHSEMELGKYYLVYIYVDLRTERIVASSKLDKFIDVWPADYQKWDKVDLIIGAKTDLGFKAIINNLHWGLLYDNEIFQPLRIGKKITGYIKQVREDERIDLSLSRPGEGKVKDFSQKLLDYMAENNGISPLHDKSSPDDIKKTLGVSKKTFKATVGNLLKKGKVKITPEGIKLV